MACVPPPPHQSRFTMRLRSAVSDRLSAEEQIPIFPRLAVASELFFSFENRLLGDLLREEREIACRQSRVGVCFTADTGALGG